MDVSLRLRETTAFKQMESTRRIGFWDPRRDPNAEAMMPWDDASLAGVLPEANSTTLTSEEQTALIEKLRRVEKRASVLACFGASWCRVCGLVNGSLEYAMDGWTWPQGFGHYIEHHHIEVDPQFRAWIIAQPQPHHARGDAPLGL